MKQKALLLSLLIPAFSYLTCAGQRTESKTSTPSSETTNNSMENQHFTSSISVDQSPEAAFAAINNVRGWWSEEIVGPTDKPEGVFDYHFQDVHRCKIKVTELVPGKKVVWQVLENYFKFTKDQREWVGTTIQFEISRQENKTHIRFTHIGLLPKHECYPVCRDAWTGYIQKSLYNLITTGKGQPNGKDKPQTQHEKELAAPAK